MRRLRIILIAHDGKKIDLVEWARFNAGTLGRHELIATAATGDAIRDIPGLTVRTLLHGPLGGDVQAGHGGLSDLVAALRDVSRNTTLQTLRKHATSPMSPHQRRLVECPRRESNARPVA